MMYCKSCGFSVFEVCPQGVCKSCNGYTMRYLRENLTSHSSHETASEKNITSILETKRSGQLPLSGNKRIEDNIEVKRRSDGSETRDNEAQWAVRVILNDTGRLDQNDSGDSDIYNTAFHAADSINFLDHKSNLGKPFEMKAPIDEAVTVESGRDQQDAMSPKKRKIDGLLKESMECNSYEDWEFMEHF
jgi:hypothetical protein